ncbi:MAG TPA: hypothetical protein DCM08_09480, partial [Microscillaceae bacterium]|nr:hypothetical protein [Microscillaceae bacterium]
MTQKLRTFLFLSIVIAVSLSLQSCGGGQSQANVDKNKANKDEKKEVKPPSRPTDRKFDDIAHFIAGMKGDEGTTLATLEQEPVWITYSNNTNAQWKKILEERWPTLVKWRDDELQATTKAGGLLFYPFSGPDFLHASTFFPSVDEIVMIGLEPIGTMPDIEKIKQAGLGAYLNGIQNSLFAILNYSFFRTLAMQVDLTGKNVATVDGTLPVLMLFMARTDHKILYYEKVAINPEGKIVPAAEIKVDAGAKDNTYYGTRLDFQAPGSDKRKTLYYFGVNLSNDTYAGLGGLNQRTDLYTFLKNLNITTTYLKSASYLMYSASFSMIRDLILEKSKYVMQDDS